MKQVFDDNFRIREAFERAPFPDGIYMSIDFNNRNVPQNPRPGLDYTLEKLAESPKTPVILYGFETVKDLFLDRRFMKFMSHPNAHYARAPFTSESIGEILSVPAFKNQALEIASKHQVEIDLVPILRHIYQTPSPKARQEAIERARMELGLAGDDKEIAKLLQDYEAKLPKEELGKLSGVFADVDGTLIKNDEINPDVVRLLVEYSQQHPITLWTGGDYRDIAKSILPKFAKDCIEQGSLLYLRTGVVSKHIFRGSHPEIVIDDLDEAEFERQYGIKPENYIHAKT